MLTVTSRAVTALLVFVSSPLARCAESKEESSFVKASSGYPSPTATVTVDWLYSSGVDEPSRQVFHPHPLPKLAQQPHGGERLG